MSPLGKRDITMDKIAHLGQRDVIMDNYALLGQRDVIMDKRTHEQHLCDSCCSDDVCNKNCTTARGIIFSLEITLECIISFS